MEMQWGEKVWLSVYSIHSGSAENNKQKAQSKENKANSKENRVKRTEWKYRGTSSDAEGRDR